jgi:hypothetical protein
MSSPLSETHVPLSINIFDQTQHALVRKHLTVERLISDILREFAQELDLNRKYILIYDGRQLDPELVIGEANFGPETELMFGYYEPVRSGPPTLSSTSQFTQNQLNAREQVAARLALLREVETGQEFSLRKNPSIIGRSSSSTGMTDGIDIDVQSFREARTVSRPHAQISRKDGQFYFEALKEQRPTFINDQPLPFGQKHLLQNGDIVGVGNIQFVFEVTSELNPRRG